LLDATADQWIKREAEKRRQTIGAMFRWALSQDIVEIDPTGGLAAYDPGMPRNRTLTVQEIERLWRWLCSDALPPDPTDVLKLELLTGARCGEISGLCVEEIDCDEWIWTLPLRVQIKPRVTPIVGMADRSSGQAFPPLRQGHCSRPKSAHCDRITWMFY
jgi:integrase